MAAAGDEGIYAMMRSCWEMNAVQRPSFSALVHWLYRRLRPMTSCDDVMTPDNHTVTSSSSRNVADQCPTMTGARSVSVGY